MLEDCLLFHIFRVYVLGPDAKPYRKLSIYHRKFENLFCGLQLQDMFDELVLSNGVLLNVLEGNLIGIYILRNLTVNNCAHVSEEE